jgi:uncharacterized repeat protein (TIGR03803 family)
MRNCSKNRFLRLALITGFGLAAAARVAAQTFTNLYTFTATDPNTAANTDGANPQASLILSGNTLYGTTEYGGSYAYGSVFKVNTDGSGFRNLHSFSVASFPAYTNSDGAYPVAGLVLSGDTLYGTAVEGGAYANGAVFRLNTDGSGFTNLHDFTPDPYPAYTNSDGAAPEGALILSGDTLFGTAEYGGSNSFGTVFALKTNGSGFVSLHGFSNGIDGGSPYGHLVLSSNTLYGTTIGGGSSNEGTVFKLSTDGTGIAVLHSFTGWSGLPLATNSDGANPYGGLVLCGSTLYGTTVAGGVSGSGTLFRVNTDGASFTNLHSFAPLANGTNSDGASPYDGLVFSGGILYGTTHDGGSSGQGTVFALNLDGTGLANLRSFSALSNGTNSDGSAPWAGLVLSGNIFYGAAAYGGLWGNGTLFSLSLPAPQLTLIPSGDTIILTWPTNYAGFSSAGYTLQTTTNLFPPVWVNNSTTPAVINGQDVVTNPISGAQLFFRLSR